MKDRQELDRSILEAMSLDPEEYLPRIYEGLTGLVRERIELGDKGETDSTVFMTIYASLAD